MGCSPIKAVRELGSERKLRCVLSQKCGKIKSILTNIGGTLTNFRTIRRAIPREEMMDKRLLAYIAGFLDGDGCIMAQLVRRKDYLYGYQIRLSIVFYQKDKYRSHLEWLKSQLKCGYIRNRNDQMTEYTIVGIKDVAKTLRKLLPHLHLKKDLTKLILQIAKIPRKPNPKQLLNYAKLVDASAKFNYSKKRKNWASTIEEFLQKHHFPVTTDSKSQAGQG